MRLAGILLCATVLCAIAPAAADTSSYQDRSITFNVPDGWTKVNLPPHDSSSDPTLVALFVKYPNQQNRRAIQVVVQDFDGSLDAFEALNEKTLKSSSDSTFIKKRAKVTLTNGMPAYWLSISSGADVGQYQQRYEYVVIDSKRGIIVTLIGRQGDFDDKEAQDALGGLTVVAYPHDQP